MSKREFVKPGDVGKCRKCGESIVYVKIDQAWVHQDYPYKEECHPAKVATSEVES